MLITSLDFADSQMIPAEFSKQGGNSSPSLEFHDIPAGAHSLALTCHDPDAATPGGFTHWVVWNITPSTTSISKNGMPMTAVQGRTDWGTNSWDGPQPPSGTHRYIFTLYALDTHLNLIATAGRQQLEQAMQGHILATASLKGLYSA